MAVVYCLSSSGALSFRSNVSTATRTLDTWLGLSGKQITETDSVVEQNTHPQVYIENEKHSPEFKQVVSINSAQLPS